MSSQNLKTGELRSNRFSFRSTRRHLHITTSIKGNRNLSTRRYYFQNSAINLSERRTFISPMKPYPALPLSPRIHRIHKPGAKFPYKNTLLATKQKPRNRLTEPTRWFRKRTAQISEDRARTRDRSITRRNVSRQATSIIASAVIELRRMW